MKTEVSLVRAHLLKIVNEFTLEKQNCTNKIQTLDFILQKKQLRVAVGKVCTVPTSALPSELFTVIVLRSWVLLCFCAQIKKSIYMVLNAVCDTC